MGHRAGSRLTIKIEGVFFVGYDWFMQTILTGVKPTHKPHLGNYAGAIRPAIEASNQPDTQTWLFIADYHSLNSVTDPKLLHEMIFEVAATWLACGMDPKKAIFYRQSDIPEIMELNWILSCMTSKGLMNRAHAYKARIQENQENGKEDLDFGVNMGLFNYPILMAADILMFSAAKVPVGEDQVQHLEIARDIAQKFNRTYGEILKVPQVVVQKTGKSIPGLDGRKMSKSYGNHIPMFEESASLRKTIMKIKTDSLPPEAPKSTEGSILYELFEAFATPEQTAELKAKFEKGIGWGYVKQDLFELLDAHLAEPRRRYTELMKDKSFIKAELKAGAEKARPMARDLLKKIRTAIGIEI
jgi:tryptophanyl-tRNA synthetase